MLWLQDQGGHAYSFILCSVLSGTLPHSCWQANTVQTAGALPARVLVTDKQGTCAPALALAVTLPVLMSRADSPSTTHQSAWMRLPETAPTAEPATAPRHQHKQHYSQALPGRQALLHV